MFQPKSGAEELLTWAERLGTVLSPEVEIYDDLTTGLSFRAAQDIPPHTRLVSCSYGTTLSFLNAVDTPGFPLHTSVLFPRLFLDTLSPEDPHIVGHFFLMQQYILGEESFWWPYIRLLPQPDKPSSIPALWSEEDQRYLDGTNAEPAIKKRMGMWSEDWKKGVSLLWHWSHGEEKYTFDLYKWAASVFGSRSFRPSLTIPETCVPSYKDHAAGDKFSILLPVMDIGNHSGINNVSWTPNSATGVFILLNRDPISQNDQIFNFYGDKSNSELLVGYGFMLSTTLDLDRDIVNLKLKPGQEALNLRRSQHCHAIPREPEEESLFAVQKQIDRGEDQRLKLFTPFSDGLVDLVICMVANKRERKYLSLHPDYCPERDTGISRMPLARAVYKALQILLAKLVSEKDRIIGFKSSRQQPQNVNQHMAFSYTTMQISVLSTVIFKLSTALSLHSYISPSTLVSSVSASDHWEFLSLQDAFGWLQQYYVNVHDAIVEMISEDQEEPLPLDWNVLVEDWDHTYWIVWIFTVWTLWARDGEAFLDNSLASWLLEVKRAYDGEVATSMTEVLHADASEIPTINLMVNGVSKLSQLSTALTGSRYLSPALDVTNIRNFASYVAHEETIFANFSPMLGGLKENVNQTGNIPDQKLLFLTMDQDERRPNRLGSWIAYASRSSRN